MVRNLDSFLPTFLKEPEAGKRKKRENQSKIRHYLSHLPLSISLLKVNLERSL